MNRVVVCILLLACCALFAGSVLGVCTEGYEPSTIFPVCNMRRIDPIRMLFAIVNSGKISDNYDGSCLRTFDLDYLWDLRQSTIATVSIQSAVMGCYRNSTHICFDDISTQFNCTCIGDCDTLMQMSSGLVSHAFYHELPIFG